MKALVVSSELRQSPRARRFRYVVKCRITWRAVPEVCTWCWYFPTDRLAIEISTGEQVKQRCVGRIKLIARTKQHHLSQPQEYKYKKMDERLLKRVRGGSFMSEAFLKSNYWTSWEGFRRLDEVCLYDDRARPPWA
jgi:hypothetical protein